MIGQLIDGRYRIVKIMGSNSFGQTYLAADTHRPGFPQCIVREHPLPEPGSPTLQIIKVLFQRKAEIIEKLGRHEQVPSILAYFEENHKLYMVEEFIAGQPLNEILNPGQLWPENQVIYLLEEVLEVLEIVHEQGVIHRHLQPDHIIRRQSDNKLVLIDFGLDREISAPVHGVNLGAGKKSGKHPQLSTVSKDIPEFTLVYKPVEQLQGNPCFSSDIYALGMIAIQALTGLSEEELFKRIEMRDSTGLIQWKDAFFEQTGQRQGKFTLSPSFASLIDKMVAPVMERYQSAQEVLEDLRKLQTRRKVSIPPETIISPISSPIVRSKNLVLILVGAGILTLVILGIISIFNTQNKLETSELYARASEKAKKGDTKGAIADYTQAIQLNLKKEEAYYKRANMYYDLAEYTTAIKDYTEALNVNPNYTKAFYNRGLAYYEIGEKRKAVEDFTEIIKLNSHDLDAYYQRGLAYYDLGDYRTAIDDYTTVIRLDANHANAYSNRGLARSALGDKQGAMSDYTQAISIQPKNPNVYYSRGRARFNLSDYKGAVDDYTEAINLDPKMVDAYTNRCNAYLNLGDTEKAISDCTQAIVLDPKDWAAYNNRCVAYLGLQKYQQAVEDCGQTIGFNPNNSKAYNNRGLSRSILGDKLGAIQDFSAAIKINPNDAVAYSNRGLIYFHQKNLKGAIQDFAQSIRINPNNASAYFNRGLIRRQVNDKNGAAEDFQKAASLFLEQGRADDYQKAQNELNQIK